MAPLPWFKMSHATNNVVINPRRENIRSRAPLQTVVVNKCPTLNVVPSVTDVMSKEGSSFPVKY